MTHDHRLEQIVLSVFEEQRRRLSAFFIRRETPAEDLLQDTVLRAWDRRRSLDLLRWPSVFTIPKASRPEHAAENAGPVACGSAMRKSRSSTRRSRARPRPRTLPML